MALLARFSRVTSSGRYIPELDGLRFIAISCIFLYHLNTFTVIKTGGRNFGYVENLHYGVQLFFTISGFILAIPFAAHYLNAAPKPSIRQYYLRRLTRIEPPYAINMLVAFAIHGGKAGLIHLFASLAYLHNLVYARQSLVNSVAWSLEIEIQFYLLAPWIMRVFAISPLARRALLILISAAAIGIQAVWPGARLDLALPGQIQYFLGGIILADLYLTEWRDEPRSFVWDAVSLLGWTATGVLINSATGRFFVCIPVFLACCGALRGRTTGSLLRIPLLATIGGMCYTIYLYHYWFIAAIARFTLPVSHNLLLQSILVGVPTLAGCSLLFLLLEKPFMKSASHQHAIALPRVPCVPQRAVPAASYKEN